MPDVLVRGLSAAAIERLDAQALALGLSRNEFLRRQLEAAPPTGDDSSLAWADWRRSAAVFGDLANPDVMAAAWR